MSAEIGSPLVVNDGGSIFNAIATDAANFGETLTADGVADCWGIPGAPSFTLVTGSSPTPGQAVLRDDATATATATASAQLTGVSSNSPLPLLDVFPNAWTFDLALGFWTHRFSVVELLHFYDSPVEYAQAIWTVQDHNDNPGGRMTLRVEVAELFVPPSGSKTYVQRASANSLGDGSIQQITLPIASYGAPAEMRLTTSTGTANAPASSALHYQLQQLRRVF